MKLIIPLKRDKKISLGFHKLEMEYFERNFEKDDLDSRFKQIRENYNFFGAPIGMIITIDRSFGRNGTKFMANFTNWSNRYI